MKDKKQSLYDLEWECGKPAGVYWFTKKYGWIIEIIYPKCPAMIYQIFKQPDFYPNENQKYIRTGFLNREGTWKGFLKKVEWRDLEGYRFGEWKVVSKRIINILSEPMLEEKRLQKILNTDNFQTIGEPHNLFRKKI